MGELLAVWPVDKRPFSLGNALVFRKELEFLAKIHQKNKVVIHFTNGTNRLVFPPYMKEAFVSKTSFELTEAPLSGKSWDWPLEKSFDREDPRFSLHQVGAFSRQRRESPFLDWPDSILGEAKAYLANLRKKKGRIYACHLKYTGINREESNAHLESWAKFFRECSQSDPLVSFLLLGHDPLPIDFSSFSNLHFAAQAALPLSLQMALCSQVDGFLGMASGVSSAAIFSPPPYVIFKHPLHHPDEMEREIGGNDYFPFASSHQKILRQTDDLPHLHSAFAVLQGRHV